MSLPLPTLPPTPSGAGTLEELQERIHVLQGRRNREGSYPVLPCFAPLLPSGLRGGTAYSLDVPLSVAMALLAGASSEGQWCGAVGFPDFGAEAAAGFGIALDRLVLVPDPGEHWFPVVAALADVLPLLLAQGPGRVAPGEAAKLGSRLRERAGTLLVLGPWPQSEAVLRMRGTSWEGLGEGYGHLSRHRVDLELTQRGLARSAVVDLSAPDVVALRTGAARPAAGGWP
ncbi:hypothetical protein [Sinomonas sp. ASV322]|uniref:hypothetical protein n=1 Tax=Sinomonas sp. ASV322 TaxID=3041920 RepID=UPI0027DD9DBB|nr:hypothetical protein [Sinomonas sp. ASV322]MDQ4501742.1 hypothetical protein [Sinomonas sp. ASV322]